MVVSGGDVVSIEVDRGSGSSSQLEGTVLVPNTKDKTLMVQLTDDKVLRIAQIMDVLLQNMKIIRY